MIKHYVLAPLAALLLLAATPLAHAQSVGIGTTAPDPSASLDVTSPANNQGLLVPRLTQTQRLAISMPATGLLVYQTDTPTGFYYNAGPPAAPIWTALTGSGDNLGTHVATQNLNLQDNALVGSGADLGTTVGLGVRADGGLNLGQQSSSLAIGYQAGTTNGAQNLYIGYQAGQANTTGFENLFIGYKSGASNTAASTISLLVPTLASLILRAIITYLRATTLASPILPASRTCFWA
jgi:hypothetical protein